MTRKESREAELEAAANELDRLAADPNLIPGIYNYCDRWCERCPQTARCLNFQMERARHDRRGRPVPYDPDNAEFWAELGHSFALALHLVQQEAKKQGLDLDSPEIRTAARQDERFRRRQATREGSALARAAGAYRQLAGEVLERLPAELRAIEQSLATQARLGAGDPHATAADISDALEVVSWYLVFIEVKLARAVASRVDEAREPALGFPRDSDGSAKVALIAIDRSLGAWQRLHEYVEGERDQILALLVELERLRRLAENEFPRARLFQRAGFPDEPMIPGEGPR